MKKISWENCHEHFLSAQFRSANPALADRLAALAAAVRSNDRAARRAIGLDLIARESDTEAPRLVNNSTGDPQVWLGGLTWTPVKIFCTAGPDGVGVTAIR